METLLKQMREAAEKRKELETEHAQAVAELRQKQEEMKNCSRSNEAERLKMTEIIQTLESRVRELLKKCELQNVLHEEISLELAALRRTKSRQQWHAQPSQSCEDKSEDGLFHTEKSAERFLQKDVLRPSASLPLTSSIQSLSASPLPSENISVPQTSSLSSSYSSSCFHSQVQVTLPSLTSSNNSASSLLTSTALCTSATAITISTVTSSSGNLPKLHSPTALNSSTSEIDRILARIEQDNRILAELEKPRTTVEPSITIQELEQLMAKLEQDNKILAELDKKRTSIDPHPPLTSSHSLPPVSLSETGLLSGSVTSPSISPVPSPSLPLLSPATQSTSSASSSHINDGSLSNVSPIPTNTAHNTTTTSLITTAAAAPPAATATTVVVTPAPAFNGGMQEEDILEDSIDSIDLPGRGRCKVYIARYSYDPLKQSPNENPEAELCLNAGDYVLIFGEMDEDGFFSGEIPDGRKGLVPSNFVEKLTGEDLFDFQATVLYGNRDSDDSSVSFSYIPDLDMSVCEEMQPLLSEDFHRMNDYIDMEDIEEIGEENLSDNEQDRSALLRVPPPPQRLILERQLNKSLLIGWIPPDIPQGIIEAYHVYVDGMPKATIKAEERTRALIEGVDSAQKEHYLT